MTNENMNMPVSDVADEFAVIAEGTKVIGDIKTKGHVAVSGTVEGNITANGNIIMNGTIKGILTCNNITFENSRANSEIEATGMVSIKDSATVTGNIKCKDIAVYGVITGNITATGNVAIFNGATVTGNITAGSLGIEMGATVNGNISMARGDK